MSLDPITLFIAFVGACNIVIYVRAFIKIKRLDEIVHPKSDRRVGMQVNMAITDDDCAELSDYSSSAARSYTFFTILASTEICRKKIPATGSCV